jgi:hypothetical protein
MAAFNEPVFVHPLEDSHAIDVPIIIAPDVLWNWQISTDWS